MRSSKRPRYRLLVTALSALTLAVWACTEADITGPDGSNEPIQLSREITLGELQEALSAAAARVEIQLFEEGQVARRLVLRHAEALADEEEVESRVSAVQALDNEGTLTLRIGELSVGFDHETHFRGPGGDDISYGAFVERVQAMLADQFEPTVEARRPPADLPQGPLDAGFFASALRLFEEGEGPAIEINIDLDNLELNTDRQDGEADGWINVLGLHIELRISDGVTELASEDAEVADEVEFEGFVESVDLEAYSFTFTDGTVVRLVEATQILEADGAQALLSLEAVKAALEDGLAVVAWGCGELESMEPRVIVARELRFAVHGDGGDARDIVEFEGFVVSVNVDLGTFTLTNGTVVRITDRTELIHSGTGETLGSLEAVREALDAQLQVIAYGAGEVESAEPLTLVALEMRFVLAESGPAIEEFEGAVASVDLEGIGSFTLGNGVVVHMREDTQIGQAEQGQPLMSLAAVREALEAQNDVVAWGRGEVEGIEPLTLAALEVYFVIP